MLKVTIPAQELYDEIKCEYVYTSEQTLQLEHSLVSLSKWESKWHKPFISDTPKTLEESLDYVRCMTLTQNVDPAVYSWIPQTVMEEIDKYINDPMTATTFNNMPKKGNREIVTAEVLYYDMIALSIPMECQKWHLNRLITLIRVCDAKNSPQQKMSVNDVMARNKAINAQRRAKYHSKG